MRPTRAHVAALTAILFALGSATLTTVPAAAADLTPAPISPVVSTVANDDTLTADLADQAADLDGKDKGRKIGVIAVLDVPAANGRPASKRSIAAARSSVLGDLPSKHAVANTTYSNLPAISLDVDATGLAALAAHEDVLTVQRNTVVKLSMVTANNLTGATQIIENDGFTGAGTTVAIIDTGVDKLANGAIHPGLAGDVVGEACFHEYGGCASATDAKDIDGHGTHVAGIITGPNGVAPSAKIYPIKVFAADGSTTDGAILAALDHVIGLNANHPGTINEVNMSLGGGAFATAESCNAANPAYRQAFATLNGQGVSTFVATGNEEYTDAIAAPACVDGAIGVGSVDTTYAESDPCWGATHSAIGQVSCFSNATPVQGEGELVDVVAPGCKIVSLGLNGNPNTTMCGTSMATPYAAGVGALAAEIAAQNGRMLTPALLEDLLESTGVQVADPRYPSTSPQFPRVSPPGIKQSLELDVPATTAIGVGTTSATVSWGSIAGATGYQVNVTSEITGDTETITVGGLTTTVPLGCGPHAITVRAVSSGGIPSLPSDPFVLTVRNCPAAVEDVTLTAIDDQSHTISWSVPDEPSGAIVLQRRSLHGQWGDVQTLPTSAVSHVDAVSSCGLVEYRVFAQDANADRSVASDVVRRGICAPANDEVAAATVLTQTPPGQAAQQITEPDAMWATSSLTDPVLSCTQGFAANTQWYTFTAAAQGRVNIRTTSAGEPSTDVDPVLAVYEGSPGASNEVACSDDAGTSLDSDVTVNVTAGQTYFVMLGNWADVAGDAASVQKLAIQWLPVGTVGNDTFAGATVLTGTGFHSSVIAARFATVASSDPIHQCARLGPRVGGGTLWWRYTPTANGKLNLSTIESTGRFADTLLSVYTGIEGSLSTVACNDDAVATVTYSSLSSVALQAGTTYSILVSSYSATMPGSANDLVTLSGTFTANAAIQPPVKPATPVATKTYKVSVKASKKAAKATKRPRKVIVTVRNAGNAASRVRIKASKAPRGYAFVYRTAAGKNITRQVIAGKYRTAILKPGSSTRITVSLKLKPVRKPALAKKKATISIRVTSVAKPAASATAKVRVRR